MRRQIAQARAQLAGFGKLRDNRHQGCSHGHHRLGFGPEQADVLAHDRVRQGQRLRSLVEARHPREVLGNDGTQFGILNLEHQMQDRLRLDLWIGRRTGRRKRLVDAAALVRRGQQHGERQLGCLLPSDRSHAVEPLVVGHQQTQPLGEDRHHVAAAEVGIVEIGDRRIQREIVEAGLHRFRAREMHVDVHAGMAHAHHFQNHRQDRRHRRHRAEPQVALEVVLHGVDLVAHRLAMGDDQPRHLGDPLALGGEPVKPLPASAQEDRHAQFEFELLDPRRQARLGHVTTLRGPAKMFFLGDRNEVFELAQEHGVVSSR